MLNQVLSIIGELVAILTAFSGSGNPIPANTLKQVQDALAKAQAIAAAFAGFAPPNSLANDFADLQVLVNAIEASGYTPADEKLASVQGIINKFSQVKAALDSGQPALFFVFTNPDTGKRVSVVGAQEGGPAAAALGV